MAANRILEVVGHCDITDRILLKALKITDSVSGNK